MRKFLRGRLQGYGRAYRLNLKDTGWGMKLVVLVITGFFCGALASEYFGTKLIFFRWRSDLRRYAVRGGSMSVFAHRRPHLASQY